LTALLIIPFLHGNALVRLRASPCWHRNGLIRTNSVLAYGQRGWPYGHAACSTRKPILARDRHHDGQPDNETDKHGAPAAGCAAQSLLLRHKNL